MAYGAILGQTSAGYSNEQILTPEVAALYGLSGTDAVPNSVFSFLGKFNQYCWAKREIIENYNVVIDGELYTGGTQVSPKITSENIVLYYSNTAYADSSGIHLSNPQSVSISTQTTSSASVALDKFFYIVGGGVTSQVYKANNISSGSSRFFLRWQTNQYPDVFWEISGFYNVFSESAPGYGSTDYVFSNVSSTYPSSGQQNGYYYLLLGKPYEYMVRNGFNLEFISYTGNGVFGSQSPNSITFENVPESFLLFYDRGVTGYLWGENNLYNTSENVSNIVSTSGNTIEWYNANNAGNQFNTLNQDYLIIGMSRTGV